MCGRGPRFCMSPQQLDDTCLETISSIEKVLTKDQKKKIRLRFICHVEMIGCACLDYQWRKIWKQDFQRERVL